MKTMLSEHTCYHPDNLKSDIKMQTTGAGRRWEARHRRQRLPQPVTAKWEPWPQSTERKGDAGELTPPGWEEAAPAAARSVKVLPPTNSSVCTVWDQKGTNRTWKQQRLEKGKRLPLRSGRELGGETTASRHRPFVLCLWHQLLTMFSVLGWPKRSLRFFKALQKNSNILANLRLKSNLQKTWSTGRETVPQYPLSSWYGAFLPPPHHVPCMSAL